MARQGGRSARLGRVLYKSRYMAFAIIQDASLIARPQHRLRSGRLRLAARAQVEFGCKRVLQGLRISA
jgi:hypothetical protein